MDPALISGGAGLAGALIGASAALGGKWIDVRHARKTERRRQTEDLIAKFWEATNRLFQASKDLRFTIEEIQASRDAKASVDHLNAQRIRELEARKQAVTEVGLLHARMRLNQLGVAESAMKLIQASGYADSQHHDEIVDRRLKALGEFETQAAKLLK